MLLYQHQNLFLIEELDNVLFSNDDIDSDNVTLFSDDISLFITDLNCRNLGGKIFDEIIIDDSETIIHVKLTACSGFP